MEIDAKYIPRGFRPEDVYPKGWPSYANLEEAYIHSAEIARYNLMQHIVNERITSLRYGWFLKGKLCLDREKVHKAICHCKTVAEVRAILSWNRVSREECYDLLCKWKPGKNNKIILSAFTATY